MLALTLISAGILASMARALGDGEAMEGCVNRRGGDVTVVHLPETGIRGNTHFPFSDLNNLEIADLMYKFPEKKSMN